MSIPLMTHELSQGWRQPDRSQILIDDKHALMTQRTFDQLSNYETTIPSGVYDGKMWRRGNCLCWYGPAADPSQCSINMREVLIC